MGDAIYWSANKLLSTSIFGSLMPRDRRFAILSYLHFANNEEADPDDKLTSGTNVSPCLLVTGAMISNHSSRLPQTPHMQNCGLREMTILYAVHAQ